MRVFITGETLRFGACLLFAILSVPSLSSAQTQSYYVRAGAAGNGSGSDWANAYPKLPSKLGRGATYYVAGGSYGYWFLNTPDSGTTPITIKVATATDHGTATGWSDGYVGQVKVGRGCPSGYGCANLFFESDYWVVDGQTRSSWTSGYGLFMQNTSNASSSCAVEIGNPYGSGGGTVASHIVIEYTEIEGSNDPTAASEDIGASLNKASSYVSFLYDWIHAVGNTQIQATTSSAITNLTVDHCFISENKESNSGTHAEAIAYTGSNLTVSNSIFRNITWTAFITDPAGFNPSLSNWDIYGNVFYQQPNLCPSSASCTVGNGIVSWLGGTTFTGTIRVINNTIANIQPLPGQSSPCSGNLLDYHDTGPQGTMVLENNVFYNDCSVTQVSSDTGLTYDYNSYYGGTNDTKDTSAHKQVISGNPFVDSAGGNYRLTADMAGSQVGVSFPLPYSVDPDGTTRGADGTWDRGAYEFVAGSAQPGAPALLVVTSIH